MWVEFEYRADQEFKRFISHGLSSPLLHCNSTFLCPPWPGFCECCQARFKLHCSCAKCLGRNWHGYTTEQMSARINWLGKVFQAPVQSIRVGDIRQDCGEPHLQQWQTLRNRMGWFSRQRGLRFFCCDSKLYQWQNMTNLRLKGEKNVFLGRRPISPRSLRWLPGNWF